MKRSLLAYLAAAALFADGNGGIPPRARSTDYPAQQASGDVTLAAALLTPAEAKKVFTADIDRAGFLVFEVAAYPARGAQIELAPDQFSLRIVNDPTVLPISSPDSIVEVLYKGKRSTPQTPGKVQVYNSATVGWESGNSSGTGTRRGGVYAGGGTAVGIGDPGQAAPPSAPSNPPVDRDTLQVELAAREFPVTKATEPVAGYLYFTKPRAKPANGLYQLTFNLSGLNGRQIVVPVPAKTGK
jgi:hypothetical protein